jgi:hypothetical protein
MIRKARDGASCPPPRIVVAPQVLPDANVTPSMEGAAAVQGRRAVTWSLATAVIVLVLTSRGVGLSRIGGLYGP